MTGAGLGIKAVADNFNDLHFIPCADMGAAQGISELRSDLLIIQVGFDRLHHDAAAAKVGQCFDMPVDIFDVVGAGEIDKYIIRLVQTSGGSIAGLLRCDGKRPASLAKADHIGQLGRHDRVFRRSQRFREQQAQTCNQLGVHNLADLGLDVYPVKNPLRIEPGVLFVAQVIHVFPGDQHIVEICHRVQFIAGSGKAVIILTGAVHGIGIPGDVGNAFLVGRHAGINDLFRLGAEIPQDPEVHPVAEYRTGSYRLPAFDKYPVVTFFDNTQHRYPLIGVVRPVILQIDKQRRREQVAVAQFLPGIAYILRHGPAFAEHRLFLPRFRIVKQGVHGCVVTAG